MRDGRLKRIPDAVVYHNVRCPRILTTKATTTTTNRDGNGTLNIAIIDFSRMASTDELPLPLFRRSSKSNKYTLSNEFLAHQSLVDSQGDVRMPTQSSDSLEAPSGL